MNKKNQLFRILPDIDIINKILSVFGLTSLDDTNMITKDTIKDNNTVERLIEMKNELEKYYLPCKRIYINNINEKRCIVILRQFIKVHRYTLYSKERRINGKKINIYRVIKDDKESISSKPINKKLIVVSFK